MKQYDNFNDLITFTRASSATYLDSDGILKTASTNIPRIEYDAEGNRLGLLVEESRTNLLTYSEDFSNSDWTKSQATFESSSTSAPDGTNTADKIIPDATNNVHLIYRVTAISSGNYTEKVFAKSGGYSKIVLREGSVTGAYATFDLTSGSIIEQGLGGSGNIKSVGNGWFSISLTYNNTGSNHGTRIYILDNNYSSGSPLLYDFQGDGTSGVYIWGAQLEAGEFATSYIPTSGSTATRSADFASIATSAFGYNNKGGSLFAEWVSSNSESQYIAELNQNNSTNYRIATYVDGTGNVDLFVNENGNIKANLDSGVDVNVGETQKVAVRFAVHDFAITADGSTAAVDTTGSPIPIPDTLDIGSGRGLSLLNGHLKSLKYYPRKLTDAQLEGLTS